jgi:hypothetical protein
VYMVHALSMNSARLLIKKIGLPSLWKIRDIHA